MQSGTTSHSRSVVSSGADGHIVEIECHASNNLPTIIIVGSASRTVSEARDRLRGALAATGLSLPPKRITINLAPADIPKNDSGLDLAIAAAILGLGGQSIPERQSVIIGELGLDGSVRPVRGIIGKLLAARAAGLTDCFIPAANRAQAQLIPGLTLFPVHTLADLYHHLIGVQPLQPVKTGPGIAIPPSAPAANTLSEIIGQEQAKRAAVIAAAGGHNLLLVGPPGTGKSMLARALSSLLPPMSREEMLEVTHLHSLASSTYDAIITERPLRSPHHSASYASLVGGGTSLKPGEISLSHHGVLLLDEFLEFNRQTLEALRQPLEDKAITITRAQDSVRYPANCILVATANPCPCGYQGSKRHLCVCDSAALVRYRSKLSGPILDRIDLCCIVSEVDHARLLANSPVPEAVTDGYGNAVRQARRRQSARQGPVLNGLLTNAQLTQHAQLTSEATEVLTTAAVRLDLSARAYLRTVKVARTIADLAGSDAITAEHVGEALGYRLARFV